MTIKIENGPFKCDYCGQEHLNRGCCPKLWSDFELYKVCPPQTIFIIKTSSAELKS